MGEARQVAQRQPGDMVLVGRAVRADAGVGHASSLWSLVVGEGVGGPRPSGGVGQPPGPVRPGQARARIAATSGLTCGGWASATKPAPQSAGQLADDITIQPCGSLMPGGMQAISPCLVSATAMPSGQEPPSCLISRASPTATDATRNQASAAMIAATTAATVSSRGAIRSRATVCDTLLTLVGAPTSHIPQPADQSDSALRGMSGRSCKSSATTQKSQRERPTQRPGPARSGSNPVQ